MHLTLAEALYGWERKLRTLEGLDYKISSKSPTSPLATIKLRGYGTPVYNDPVKRGDIHIDVRISYPEALSTRQRRVIGSVLEESAYRLRAHILKDSVWVLLTDPNVSKK